MKKLYYEKRGRRYYPVSEYDSEYLDSFPKGNHLVMVYPGGSSRRYNIDPNYAGMIAAGRVALDRISESIRQSTELRPLNREMTLQDHERWIAFLKTMPDDMRFMMTHGSAREAAEAGIKAISDEWDSLMTNPAVRKAYEKFLMICELAKDDKSNSQ